MIEDNLKEIANCQDFLTVQDACKVVLTVFQANVLRNLLRGKGLSDKDIDAIQVSLTITMFAGFYTHCDIKPSEARKRMDWLEENFLDNLTKIKTN